MFWKLLKKIWLTAKINNQQNQKDYVLPFQWMKNKRQVKNNKIKNIKERILKNWNQMLHAIR